VMADKTPKQCPLAVILAAGEGSRLKPACGGSKPIAPLMGLSLGERTLCACAKAGVRRFLIVLGHRGEEVRAHFEEIGLRRGFKVDFKVADDWTLGNGASVLAAADFVGDELFLLTMVDHMVEPGLYRKLLQEPPRSGEICLAVDRNRNGLFDVEDTTKVSLINGHVQAIGKDLKAWDAADTGVFLCTPALFKGIEKARARDRHGLSDGVSELAGNGAVRAVDVTGEAWLDVDDPKALREAERSLIDSLHRGKGKEDGYISIWLNRPISVWISTRLARTRITPDQITVASFLIALVAAGFFAAGGFAAGLVGGILLQAASVLDGCDGEVARLKECGSERGAWLDTILDRYSDLAVSLAITYGYAVAHPGALPWVGGMLAGGGFLLASYVTKEYQLRFGVPYPNDTLNRLKRHDLRVFILFLGALAGAPFAALLFIGALTHLLLAGIILKGWRRTLT